MVITSQGVATWPLADQGTLFRLNDARFCPLIGTCTNEEKSMDASENQGIPGIRIRHVLILPLLCIRDWDQASVISVDGKVMYTDTKATDPISLARHFTWSNPPKHTTPTDVSVVIDRMPVSRKTSMLTDSEQLKARSQHSRTKSLE